MFAIPVPFLSFHSTSFISSCLWQFSYCHLATARFSCCWPLARTRAWRRLVIRYIPLRSPRRQQNERWLIRRLELVFYISCSLYRTGTQERHSLRNIQGLNTAKDRALSCRPFRTRSLHLPLPLFSKDRVLWELIKSNTKPCSVRASSNYASIWHFCFVPISFTCDREFAINWVTFVTSRNATSIFDRNQEK